MLSKEIPLSVSLNEMNVLGNSRDKFSPEERGVRDHMFSFTELVAILWELNQKEFRTFH